MDQTALTEKNCIKVFLAPYCYNSRCIQTYFWFACRVNDSRLIALIDSYDAFARCYDHYDFFVESIQIANDFINFCRRTAEDEKIDFDMNDKAAGDFIEWLLDEKQALENKQTGIEKKVRQEIDTWIGNGFPKMDYFQNFFSILPFGHQRSLDNFKPPDSKYKGWRGNVSIRRFYAEVDHVIAECRIDLSVLEMLQEAKLSDTTDTTDFIHQYCFTVYLKLREIGYSHHDLCD
jgi:hypothetical protein